MILYQLYYIIILYSIPKEKNTSLSEKEQNVLSYGFKRDYSHLCRFPTVFASEYELNIREKLQTIVTVAMSSRDVSSSFLSTRGISKALVKSEAY